jgi:hypothetical protein
MRRAWRKTTSTQRLTYVGVALLTVGTIVVAVVALQFL